MEELERKRRLTSFQLRIIFQDKQGAFGTLVGATTPRQEWQPPEIEAELYYSIVKQQSLLGL